MPKIAGQESKWSASINFRKTKQTTYDTIPIPRAQIKIVEQRLAKMEMSLEISDAALQKIAEAGFDPAFGARPLKRAIQQFIENPISRMILEGKLGPKDVVKIDVKNGELSFEKKAA